MPALDIRRAAEIEVLRPDGDIAGEHGRFLKTGAAGKDSFDAGLRRQRHFAVRRQSGRDLRIGVKSDGIAAFKRHRTVRRKTSAAYFKFFTGRDRYLLRFRFRIGDDDIGEERRRRQQRKNGRHNPDVHNCYSLFIHLFQSFLPSNFS